MGSPVGIFSARADGATTIALGLAACLSARGRTLLVDLNLDCPEVAPLLDLSCSKTVYHLAYNAQLAPVSPDELEEHLGWRDGLAVLPGITHTEHADRITDHFLVGLLEAASQRFESVVIDLGRMRRTLASPLTSTSLLWVVQPSPLGMEALERTLRRLADREDSWLASARLVLNRVSEHSLMGAERYVHEEYALEVAASVPDTPDYWRRVELEHSARAISVANPDHPRYLSAHGEQALLTRRAMEQLAARTLARAVREPVGAGGV
jgi:MinD-like ATPase involved in chromosome partitioning or flagellar assembly